MKINLPSIAALSLDLRQTFNSTMYENVHYVTAYNMYYIKNILNQGGIFTNKIKYNIHKIRYIPSQNIPYKEIRVVLDIDSPFINTIETIYNNSEKQILEVQKEYNKTLHINDITNIIQQEQKKVLGVSNQTILYNDVTNEQYEKMGYIQNKIEILE